MKLEYLPKTREGRRWRLAEECAEVIHALSKIGRFGEIGTGYNGHDTNTDALLAEIADLEHAIAVVKADIVSRETPPLSVHMNIGIEPRDDGGLRIRAGGGDGGDYAEAYVAANSRDRAFADIGPVIQRVLYHNYKIAWVKDDG